MNYGARHLASEDGVEFAATASAIARGYLSSCFKGEKLIAVPWQQKKKRLVMIK